MKTIIILLALVTVTAIAETPAQIAADYRAKAAPALEKVNVTLEKATVPIIAELVKAGDTTGADEVKTQLKAKQDGEPVMKPHPKAASLFALYDSARLKALEPAQAAAIRRIEALLTSSDGKKLDVVDALGKVRSNIESGKIEKDTSKNFLRDHAIPKKWGYYLTAKYDKAQGFLILKEDGTIEIEIPSPSTGTWTPTGDPLVLALDIKNAANIPEKTELVIKGKEATLKRVSGMRYLKAD